MKIAFSIPNITLRCRKCMATTMPQLNGLLRRMEADIPCDCDDPGLELVMESSPAGPVPLAILPMDRKLGGYIPAETQPPT